MKEYTVVVPVYNVEKYLNRCVDSILGQTIKPARIILVACGRLRVIIIVSCLEVL